MTTLEQINVDFKESLKSRNELELGTLRLLKSAITKKEKEGKGELSEMDIIQIVSKEIAQRNDSVKMFNDAGRTEMADKETKEIEILKKYLPEQLSDQELEKIIDEAIIETGAKEMKDMGKVMAQIMTKVAGKAEGTKVSMSVKEKLNN